MGVRVGFECAFLTYGLFFFPTKISKCYLTFSYLMLLRDFLFGHSPQDLSLNPPAAGRNRRAFVLHQTTNLCHAISALYGRYSIACTCGTRDMALYSLLKIIYLIDV